MRNTLILLFAGTLLACAGIRVPEPDSPQGKIYLAKCGACHEPPQPNQYFFTQWQRLMTLIERRIEHSDMAPLTAQERDSILAYLEKHALKAHEEELTLPDPLRPK